MPDALPPIPARRQFTLAEAAELCGVTPELLRGWEQRFAPSKRPRRHYQHHELLMLRRIRALALAPTDAAPPSPAAPHEPAIDFAPDMPEAGQPADTAGDRAPAAPDWQWLRDELLEIRKILTAS